MLTKAPELRAHTQWASRPADERFVNLIEMQDHFLDLRSRSRSAVLANRRLEAKPVGRDGLLIEGNHDAVGITDPTNWAFGQLAALAGAPPSYLRKIPAPLAADCLNYGLFTRDIEEVGTLVRFNSDGSPGELAAATGPKYGRIWNVDVVSALIKHFGVGDGTDGSAWKVPGEFGKDVPITKSNTTLYASDRDMFVFLCDEKNRIEVPNRRNGQPGQLARGFFMWNSEVGKSSFGVGTFLFDFVCMNRIIWGMDGYEEITIRHTAGAPDRFLEEVAPAVERLRDASTTGITQAIEQAKEAKLEDKVDEFLAKRFSRGLVSSMKTVHELEEGRPIETIWDAVTAATAIARDIPNSDTRVDLEKQAGKLLQIEA